jgi:origin recognition complex subunit 4
MGRESAAEEALKLIRSRLCDPSFVFRAFSDSPESNYRCDSLSI